jgi:uncharacterized protein YjbI with pentapeptide repeats
MSEPLDATAAGTPRMPATLPLTDANVMQGDLARRLPVWIVPAFAVGVVLGTAGTLWALWWWINGIPGLTGTEFATAKLDATKIALSITVGGGGLFALYLAVRRQRATEQDLRDRRAAQRHTENDASERRITELFSRAAEQLGSDKHTIRLAGLYALERLAQSHPAHRQTIVSLLCAYLRTPYTAPPARALARGIERSTLRNIRIRSASSLCESTRMATAAVRWEAILEQDARLTTQQILADHLCPDLNADGTPNPRYWPEEINLDLSGANLINLNLFGCVIHSANFIRTTFTGSAGFSDATFTGRVVFAEATFTRFAMFEDSNFNGHANFGGVTFADVARFENATSRSGVTFTEAIFNGDTRFEGATFARSADRRTEPSKLLKDAVAKLGAADGPNDHRWPHGWHCEEVPQTLPGRKGRWARLVYTSDS